MDLIMSNLKLLGINHNNFVFESTMVKKKIVSKIV